MCPTRWSSACDPHPGNHTGFKNVPGMVYAVRMMMAGLRERKKEQARRRIAEVALRLFDERGYDAVTVNEVAEAAGVAKVTLFAYFPSKDSLVLDGVKEDTAAIVAGRGDRPPLQALREHYRLMVSRTRARWTSKGCSPGSG